MIRTARSGRKRLKPGCLILTLILSVSAAFAQEASGKAGPVRQLSPDEAVDLAIKNNLGLEATRIGTETQKRSSAYAWNTFIPSASLSGGMSRDNKASTTTVESPFPRTIKLPQWHMAGSFEASLGINIAQFERIKNLRLQYETGLVGYESAKAQLERDVRKSYYDILLLQENLAILRESFTTAQRRVEMTRANYEAGLVPELAWLQARVSMENLKPTIDEMENLLKTGMANFAMYLGLPYDTQFDLEELTDDVAFLSLDVQDLISRAASGKPEIEVLRQQILVLRSDRRAAIYQAYTPSFSISWNTGATFIADPWKDSWSTNDNWTHSGSLTLGLRFQLDSLFPFSASTQAVKALDDQLRIRSITLAQAVQGTELEIYNTILSLEKARITVEAQNLTADLAERTYRLSEEAYRAGLRELLEVQNDELALRQARLEVLRQNFTYLKGLIDLEYSIGVPFGTLSSSK